MPALMGAAFLSVVCVAAADRRRSFAGILGVVPASQPVLHVLLSLSHEPAATAAVAPGRGMVLRKWWPGAPVRRRAVPRRVPPDPVVGVT